MIERFVLPDRSVSTRYFINAASRRSFDCLQDVRECKCPSLSITHSRDKQVHVVRHNDRSMQMESSPVVICTMPEGKISSIWREYRMRESSKGNKQRTFISLIVRQAPAVFVSAKHSLRHEVNVRQPRYMRLRCWIYFSESSENGNRVRFRGQECPRHTTSLLHRHR
jgi:hypothetical protein